MKKYLCILFCSISFIASAQKIDRQAVVRRHTIHIDKADSLNSLTVGNGNFAMTVDVTGMQSFPEFYQGGVPLGTQSTWGWAWANNDTNKYRFSETLKEYELAGRKIPYPVQWKEPARNKNAADFFRANPHRAHLANIGLEITKKNGDLVAIGAIQNIDQQLDMWTGEIHSRFTVEGEPVDVITYAHQEYDGVGFKIASKLIAAGKLKIRLRFPTPIAEWKDVGIKFIDKQDFPPAFEQSPRTVVFPRGGLNLVEHDVIASPGNWKIQGRNDNEFVFSPGENRNEIEIAFNFSLPGSKRYGNFSQTQKSSRTIWKQFWQSGGAIDFSGSTDKRAVELERRMILSQYLTRVNCSGAFPPQETGLTYNSWFGKPHLEMHWWHAVHFALWGRSDLMERSLDWYFSVADEARAIAKRQGFEGLRWQKMVDHAGKEAPSSVGSFLIWQQPHFIYMAELLYREKKSKAVLEKYKKLLFETADFMVSYPSYDTEKKRYVLGPGLIPAQECFDAVTTFNPTYELAYWHWGLQVAQQWRERLGLPREKKWDDVMQNLSPLPQADGVYLATESTPDCYTNEKYLVDHPAVLAAYASIPAVHRLDTTIMKNTFDKVWKIWKWTETWGWDFPLTAMTATRLGLPGKAIDALLMPVQTNTYLVNGHNYQDGRLTIYLPGNGGLLAALAMMCAGYDGSKIINPGFPKDGSWKVRSEGLRKIF